MLDDACNYLALRNMKGNHRTVRRPPLRKNAAVDCVHKSLPATDYNDSERLEGVHLLVWSAADEAGLERLASVYGDYMKQSSRTATKDFMEGLAYSLAAKRSNLYWRSYVVTTDVSQVQDLRAKFSKATKMAEIRNLVFIFTGQGAQYFKMGLELLSYDVFRKSLQEAESFFLSLGCNWSLMGICASSQRTSVSDISRHFSRERKPRSHQRT